MSFQGAHYQLVDAQLRPRPLQVPSIPVWTAAQWPNRKPLRRAARFDGVYLASENANGKPLTHLELQVTLS